MTLYQNGHLYSFVTLFRFNPAHKQPFIKVEMTSLLTKKSGIVIGLMDTGATTSVLTFKTANLLGIRKPKKGTRWKCKTATGKSITCYQHPVTVQVTSSCGNRYVFTLNPRFAKEIETDSFGMDWTLNFCLAFDRQSVHLLRD